VIRDYILGVLAVPLSDAHLTGLLADRAPEQWAETMDAWLQDVARLNPKLLLSRIPERSSGKWLVFECRAPYGGSIGFRFVGEDELASAGFRTELESEIEGLIVTVCVLVCCIDVSTAERQSTFEKRVAEFDDVAEVILVEPTWAAAALLEHLMPILHGVDLRDDAGTAAQYFSDTDQLPVGISIRRARVPLQSMLGAVFDEPGTFAQKYRQLQGEDHFEGTVLLATTFLPPVTHSLKAVKRFYSSYGVTDATLALVEDKWRWERRQWEAHVRANKRIDLLDRGQLEEYFAAPEYYQMPLTTDELKEQLQNVLQLLQNENYTMCLTSEAIDISYETRGTEVRIRTDRRNKGQPRTGRISGLVFNEPAMAEMFEREFWNMFRFTPPEFKNKDYIADWLSYRVSRYLGPSAPIKIEDSFDVFLCHNSRDKAAVKEIGALLRNRGIKPWLDEWNLVPGRPWQRALEAQIANIHAAAAFVGEDGLGPWQHMELDAFLREFVSRGSSVIPVILSNVGKVPELPIFLKGMHWVDFRVEDPDPMQQLIWGIRGKR